MTPIPRRRTRPRPALILLGALTAALVALPLVFVMAEATSGGLGRAGFLLARPKVVELLGNTARLVIAVTVLSVFLGTVTAWLTECTDLPGAPLWRVLLVLPVAIPEFVSGYAWVSFTSTVRGFGGAVLISTMSLYPLVYLPVVAMLRRRDPTQDDVARSLGLTDAQVIRRVVIPTLRPAMLAGALIVSLHLLGEYGAFSIVRYPTFATEIVTEYDIGFDPAAAGMLSMVLVVLCSTILAAESRAAGATTYARIGAGAARPSAPARLGRALPLTLASLTGLAALALGVPVATLGYWLLNGGSTTLPPASIWSATSTTLLLSLAAAGASTLCALPVALLAVRYRTRLTLLLERGAYTARALPGAVVALALVFFALRYAPPLYQSIPLLITSYVVLFLPLALTAIRAVLVQIPARLAEIGEGLGVGRGQVLIRITLPLLAPGLGAGAALVFLATATELTSTLLLRPTGLETLATQFWVYLTGLAYGAAAPYAALMIAVSAGPTYFLTRWQPSTATAAAPFTTPERAAPAGLVGAS